jgi:hypothetical protein
MSSQDGIVVIRYDDSIFVGQEKAGVINGWGIVRLNNGDYYRGQFKDGLFHGYGEMRTQALFYKGSFVNGARDGLGRQVSSNKSYFGFFKEDRKHGVAIVEIDHGKEVIRGYYRSGHVQGFGILELNLGEKIFTGYFKNSKLNDIGMEQCKKYNYLGQFHDNKKHGFGMINYTEGSKYMGSWENDLRHGHGIENSSNGDVYEGSYDKGKKTGFCKAILKEKGVVYVGSIDQGLWDGFGRLSLRDGTYVGNFARGLRNGLGSQRVGDNDIYFGSWVNNKREGFGMRKTPDREYIGEWLADEPHGRGLISDASGRRRPVQFDKGRMVNRLPDNVIPELEKKYKAMDFDHFNNYSSRKLKDIEELITKSNEGGDQRMVEIKHWFNSENKKLQDDLAKVEKLKQGLGWL